MSARRLLRAISPRVRTARRWTRGEPQGGRQGPSEGKAQVSRPRYREMPSCAANLPMASLRGGAASFVKLARRVAAASAVEAPPSLGGLRQSLTIRRTAVLSRFFDCFCDFDGLQRVFDHRSLRRDPFRDRFSPHGLFMGDMRSRAWLDRAEPCILREMPVAGLALSRRNNATAGLAGSAAPGNR